MKCAFFLVFAAAVVVVSSLPAHPISDESGAEPLYAENSPEESRSRSRRATCDAGSFTSKWFTPNHAFCAVHCIAKGFKGGNCQKTICHCRN